MRILKITFENNKVDSFIKIEEIKQVGNSLISERYEVLKSKTYLNKNASVLNNCLSEEAILYGYMPDKIYIDNENSDDSGVEITNLILRKLKDSLNDIYKRIKHGVNIGQNDIYINSREGEIKDLFLNDQWEKLMMIKEENGIPITNTEVKTWIKQ